MALLDSSTLGPARLGFADERDVDAFVSMLGQFERGEIAPDAWKQFRLVNGVYSQRQEGDSMMVRVKIPQGILTPAQLRTLGEVAERFSTGRGHITTRQNVQFHFVRLAQTDDALKALADAGLTTREACGNAVRNVTTCPFAGASALEPFDATPYAEAVTRMLLRGPLSSSLPRKFKIAFGGCCGRDCVGASFNDIGFLARVKDGKPGFRVTLAGGLSTLRRAGILAHEFAPAEDVLEIAEAVLRVFNRTGNRKQRHRARLKFVVESLGPDEFLKQYFEERARVGSLKLEMIPIPPTRLRRSPQPRPPQAGFEEFAATNVAPQRRPEYAAVTVRVPLGDLTAAQLRALADLAEEFSEEREARTTVEQNLVLRFVRRAHVAWLHAALSAIGLGKPGAGTIGDVVSCPGAMSCRLAVTQSRGMANELSRALEGRSEKLDIRISGCPNGCGQHYVAGVGLQGSVRRVEGRLVPQYHLYLGGGFGAETASFGRLAAKIPARHVTEAVRRLADAHARGADLSTVPLADLEELRAPTPEDFVDLGESKSFEVQTTEGECAA
ncbi:MAG TPA: nitrite/sulfite reductase [Myxococcales bacterium]|nr:nitrite/sulfite reductase [Myxococcales bacterium]